MSPDKLQALWGLTLPVLTLHMAAPGTVLAQLQSSADLCEVTTPLSPAPWIYKVPTYHTCWLGMKWKKKILLEDVVHMRYWNSQIYPISISLFAFCKCVVIRPQNWMRSIGEETPIPFQISYILILYNPPAFSSNHSGFHASPLLNATSCCRKERRQLCWWTPAHHTCT